MYDYIEISTTFAIPVAEVVYVMSRCMLLLYRYEEYGAVVHLLLVGHEVVPPTYQRRVVMVPNILKVLDAALQIRLIN